MVPGIGTGPEVDKAVSDGIGEEATDADHVASVETPLGRLAIFRYHQVRDGETWECDAIVAEFSSSAGCTDEPGRLDVSDPATVRLAGAGVAGEWGTVEMRASSDVASLAATADDGAVYRSNFLAGVAIVVYPVGRGRLAVQGFDAEGAPIGNPVTVLEGDQAPAPEG